MGLGDRPRAAEIPRTAAPVVSRAGSGATRSCLGAHSGARYEFHRTAGWRILLLGRAFERSSRPKIYDSGRGQAPWPQVCPAVRGIAAGPCLRHSPMSVLRRTAVADVPAVVVEIKLCRGSASLLLHASVSAPPRPTCWGKAETEALRTRAGPAMVMKNGPRTETSGSEVHHIIPRRHCGRFLAVLGRPQDTESWCSNRITTSSTNISFGFPSLPPAAGVQGLRKINPRKHCPKPQTVLDGA